MQIAFNPANWYWRADDGRVFASASQTITDDQDAGFKAWAAAGRPVTTWPRDAGGNQTTAALQGVLSDYGLFCDLKAYAAAVRYSKEVGGTTIGGVAYPTDRETQAKLTAAALFAQVDNTQTFRWKLADGNFSDAMSGAQMLALAAAVGGFVNQCFAIEQSVGAQIDAGTINARAQVDAAFA